VAEPQVEEVIEVSTDQTMVPSVIETDADRALATPPQSSFSRFLRRFLRQTPALVALGYLVALLGVAVFAPLIAPFDPNKQDLLATFASPSAEHWFGTDNLGRDVFSRVVFAGRISLTAAAQAVVIALALGVVPGLIAGFFRGIVDSIFSRVADLLMSFPPLILAIAIVAVLGPGLTNAMVAIGVIFAPRFFRLVRGMVLGVRQETYIEAARSIGLPRRKIVVQHVLPNVLSPLTVQISLTAAMAMLAEASLSFLGLGVQPPDASWGSMIESGFRYTASAPWLTIFPGIPIALTVLAFNLLGDGIRDSIGRESFGGL
jgi:ABC-type dipeptide/oligopeptide/nickel transport system permease subunit